MIQEEKRASERASARERERERVEFRSCLTSKIRKSRFAFDRVERPADPAGFLATSGLAWSNSLQRGDEDWVFASPDKSGQQPYWLDSALRRAVRSAAVRAGIVKHIGWHTFRHSFATLLKGNGEEVKTVQESLRHANSRITDRGNTLKYDAWTTSALGRIAYWPLIRSQGFRPSLSMRPDKPALHVPQPRVARADPWREHATD
jgi:integrase